MKKIFFIFLLILPINVYSIIYPIEPRYASLKKDRVYLRYNASFDAPIKFIYQKKNLPILIIIMILYSYQFFLLQFLFF